MRARTYLVLSTAPAALHGCGIPGSNYAEFAPSNVRPPVIDKPTETDDAE